MFLSISTAALWVILGDMRKVRGVEPHIPVQVVTRNCWTQYSVLQSSACKMCGGSWALPSWRRTGSRNPTTGSTLSGLPELAPPDPLCAGAAADAGSTRATGICIAVAPRGVSAWTARRLACLAWLLPSEETPLWFSDTGRGSRGRPMRAVVLYTQSMSSLSHRSHRASGPQVRVHRFFSSWQRSHAARSLRSLFIILWLQ